MQAESSVRRTLAAELERHGLSAAGFSALVVLTTAGGELELRTLRRRLGWTKASASEVTATLAARGLVDPRATAARPPSGAAADHGGGASSSSSDLFPAHTQRVSRTFAALDDGREALARGALPQTRRLSARTHRIDSRMSTYRPVDKDPVVPRARGARARALARARRLPRVDPPPRGRRRRSSSTRARRPPTAARARTTSWRASSRTSSRATRRCAATCVPRKAGWDTHGLPVELEVEKELGITVEGRHRALRRRGVQRALPRVGAPLHRRVERAHRADRLLDRHRRRLLHARQRVHRVGLVVAQAGLGEGPALPRATRSCPTARAAARRCPRTRWRSATRDVVDPSVYVRFPLRDEPGRVAARLDDDAVDAAARTPRSR